MRTQYQAFMQYLVQRWETSEACQKPLVGCTPEQVEAIRIAQGVERLPELFVEFLLAMGQDTNEVFLFALGYPAMLVQKDNIFPDLVRPNILVLNQDWDGDCALYIHTDEDDPIVHFTTITSYDSEGMNFKLKAEALEPFSVRLAGAVDAAIEMYEIIKQREQEKHR